MPAKVNVNYLTVVHGKSSGMAISFPDVCKTPTPGGPIPIPYPNIAQSSDTSDGSSTVKMDKKPIVLKSSNFKTSSGDEAGSAQGIVSNKIKGKAKPLNASFDVKVDGEPVFRLTDPMETNNGGSSNTVCAAEVQGPLTVGTLQTEECEKTREKLKDGEEIASKNSGMHPDHFAAIKEIAQQEQVVFYFRQTEGICLPWIDNKHQPKPHRVFKANTIKNAPMVEEVQAWLDDYAARLSYEGASDGEVKLKINAGPDLLGSNKVYSSIASDYLGVIGEGSGKREPLKAVGTGPQLSGRSYKNKWITADYDLYQVLKATAGCEELPQAGPSFNKLKRAVNKACDWDAIQHGPQAQWIPSAHDREKGAPDVNFPAAVKGALASGDASTVIEIEGRKPMKVIDENVTVIGPDGVLFLEEKQELMEALICKECEK